MNFIIQILVEENGENSYAFFGLFFDLSISYSFPFYSPKSKS